MCLKYEIKKNLKINVDDIWCTYGSETEIETGVILDKHITDFKSN